MSASSLVFGKYEAVRRIAVGGMGEIFLARQTVAGIVRPVILKNLLPDLAEQQDFVDQFLDEARTIASLSHPNIVSIYEVGLWRGVYFIAMEYINGDSLDGILRRSKTKSQLPPLPVVAYMVRDAALGLEYAHTASGMGGEELNLVHRDISLHNIMVNIEGVTKVVDFGVAKATNRAARTATGVLKGKLQYMAPELLQKGSATAASDQFALGVVLWELLSGARLFASESQAETFRKILQEPIPPISEVSERTVPPELEEIAVRMLDREAEKRYESCGDVAVALNHALDALSRRTTTRDVADFVRSVVGDRLDEDFKTGSISVSTIDLFSASDESESTSRYAAKPSAANRFVLLVALLVAVVLGAGATWFLAQRQPEPTQPPPAIAAAKSNAPAAPGSVFLISEPAGATVVLNGEKMGQTPLTVEDLVPGSDYSIEVSLEGYLPAKKSFSVSSGQVKPVAVRLKPDPKAKKVVSRPPPVRSPSTPPPVVKAPPVVQEDGFLTINTKPFSQVKINGKPVGTTPVYKHRINPGKHTVELMLPGSGKVVTKSVKVKPGKNTKLSLDLTE